ncbi:hypothetical protein B0H19DRAFT_1224644 [Mycena capillaripes]|nr:hypothetical protein B0H19DRAFT_1224644 [Mycena capillaripes]
MRAMARDLLLCSFSSGIYLVLFCVCIHILLHRQHNPGNTVLLITATALFTLSTVQAVINLILGTWEIEDFDAPFDKLEKAGDIIYGVNNIIADGLVIYRCYVVWDRNVFAVIVPLLMLLVTSVFAVDIQLPANPFFSLSLATNVIVMALTAGRIWWICRQCRLHFKFRTQAQRRCMSTISILVESGVLYSATVLAYLIVRSFPDNINIVQEPIYQMLTQVMGIAPTLIIVRVGLGVGVHSMEGTIKTIQITLRDQQSVKDFDNDESFDVEKGRMEFRSSRSSAF